jgi:hypothetical protein
MITVNMCVGFFSDVSDLIDMRVLRFAQRFNQAEKYLIYNFF